MPHSGLGGCDSPIGHMTNRMASAVLALALALLAGCNGVKQQETASQPAVRPETCRWYATKGSVTQAFCDSLSLREDAYLPECGVEDDIGPCIWLAGKRSEGRGRTYVTIDDTPYYLY